MKKRTIRMPGPLVEGLTQREFPRFCGLENSEVLVGAGCRYKKLGFVEMQSYAFGVYCPKEALREALKKDRDVCPAWQWLIRNPQVAKRGRMRFLRTLPAGLL